MILAMNPTIRILWLPTILMMMLTGKIGLVCSSAGGCSMASLELKGDRTVIENNEHVVYISGKEKVKQAIKFDILRACDDTREILLDIHRYDESRPSLWVPLCSVAVNRYAVGCHCSESLGGISCVIEQTFDDRMSYRYKMKERKARFQDTEFIVKLYANRKTTEAISTTTTTTRTTTTTLLKNREVPTADDNVGGNEVTQGGPTGTTQLARILESKQDVAPNESPDSVPLWVFVVVVAAAIVLVIVIVLVVIMMRRRNQNIQTARQAGENIYYDADPSMLRAEPEPETGPGSVYEHIRNQPVPRYSAVNRGTNTRANNESRQGSIQQQSANTMPTHFHSTSDCTPPALLSCGTDSPADEIPPLPERNFSLEEMSTLKKKKEASRQQLSIQPANPPAMRVVQTSPDEFLITSETAGVSIPMNLEQLAPPLICKIRQTPEAEELIPVESNPLNKPVSPQHIYESLCQVSSEGPDSGPKRAPDTFSGEGNNYLHVVNEEDNMANSSESEGTLKKGGSAKRQRLPLNVQTPAIRVSFARHRSTTSSGSEGGELSPESPSNVLVIKFEGHPMSPISVSTQPFLENPCYAVMPVKSAVEHI